jgi:hypothetical protein
MNLNISHKMFIIFHVFQGGKTNDFNAFYFNHLNSKLGTLEDSLLVLWKDKHSIEGKLNKGERENSMLA